MLQSVHDANLRDELVAATPGRMVVIVYEETIRSLDVAITAIENDDAADRCLGVNRAMDILAHLYSCLDLENGGEIAGNLGQLYRYILAHLGRVNTANDPQPARDAIALLEPLLSSWRQIDGQQQDAVSDAPIATSEHATESAPAEAAGR
jgi:flagellar protein FliS